MPRKVLFLSAFVFFAGGLVFGLLKLTKAAQTPDLSNVYAISACGFGLNFTTAEPAEKFETQTAKNPGFTSPRITFDAKDENGNLISGSGDLHAVTNSSSTGYPAGEFYNPSGRYYFRIRAYAVGGGVSGWSNVLDDTANQIAVPGAPQNLRADGRDDGSKIYLSWEYGNPPPYFDEYGKFGIWRAVSTDGGQNYGSFNLVEKVPARRPDGSPFLDYEDNDRGNWLNPNYSYRYYLKAYQTEPGCADEQFIASDPSGEAIVPVKPTGVSADAVNVSQVEISWNDNSRGAGNESFFEIWRAVGNNAAYFLKYQASADATDFTDNNVQPNQNYFYKIKACKATGSCSAFSNEAQAVIGAAPVDDLAGSILFADGVNSTANIYLSWNAATGNTYTVLRKEVGTETETPVLGCSGAAISECRSSGVPLGKKYEYRLKIQNGGDTAYSNIVLLNLDIRLILKGSGWSSAGAAGIGWIKFRSDENASAKYSVQIDNEGFLSGGAWAGKNYGWLSFNKSDLAGCPSAPCEAKFNSAAGFLSGWGRFLIPKFFPDQSSFDGWVKLKGNNYGVEFASSTRQFSGVGWGDSVAGWVAFGSPECNGCSVRGDIIGEEVPEGNRPPVASNVRIEAEPTELWCAENPYYRVRWDYTDPNNDPQNKAEIEFIPNDFATTSLGADITLLFDPLAYLRPSASYVAKVRVFDGEFWSDWASSDAITTPSHYLPFVDFSWLPDSIVAGQPVEFTDKSADRSNGAYPRGNWTFDWRFANATPENATGSPATTAFRLVPSDATLTVSDGSGDSCSLSQRVGGTVNYKRRIFRER